MVGDTNLFALFTTGLLAGGIACIAVQGGLLATAVMQQESQVSEAKEEKRTKRLLTNNRLEHLIPISSFLIAKLVAYTILGTLLGWLGSLLQLSLQVHLILQFVVVIFMLGTALELLHVHPIFRYFIIQPPHFLTRLIHKQSKRHDIFAPALLGAFTIFVPCGATQAMMALAVSSGSPLAGAAILFAFILGTTPVFFAIGYFTMKLGTVLRARFTKVAGLALLLLTLFTFNGALALTGTAYTFSNMIKTGFCAISYCASDLFGTPVSDQTILITPSGYTPSSFAVAAGSLVTVRLVNDNAVGCQQAFTVPALHLQKIVAPNKVETFTFTAPSKPTTIAYMCSMGLYPGTIHVL